MISAVETTWASIVARYTAPQIEFFGPFIVQIFCFWLPSTIYLSLDYLFPAFSERHKLQPAPKQPTVAEIKHCTLIILRNQLISLSLTLSLIHLSLRAGRPSAFRISPALPPLSEFIPHFLACCLLREVLFYYAHRALHLPALYRRIHKTHHKFTAPVALAAQYAHPMEHIVANSLPIALPPVLLGVHILTMLGFLGAMLLETCTVHSGYDFFGGLARGHDAHHEKFNVYFGALGIMDWVHGTGGTGKRQVRGEGGEKVGGKDE